MADCDKSSPGGRYLLTFPKWMKALKGNVYRFFSSSYNCKQCQLLRMFCKALLKLSTRVCLILGQRRLTMVNFTQPGVGSFPNCPVCKNDDPWPQPASNGSSYIFYIRLDLKGGAIEYVF